MSTFDVNLRASFDGPKMWLPHENKSSLCTVFWPSPITWRWVTFGEVLLSSRMTLSVNLPSEFRTKTDWMPWNGMWSSILYTVGLIIMWFSYLDHQRKPSKAVSWHQTETCRRLWYMLLAVAKEFVVDGMWAGLYISGTLVLMSVVISYKVCSTITCEVPSMDFIYYTPILLLM